jgi:pimeloyl-ACP methyl ester carboxylesterase
MIATLARRYRLPSTVTGVDSRPVRSLTVGTRLKLPEVVLVPGLGAPGYLVPWARELGSWTQATILDLPGWRAGRPQACAPRLAGIAAATAGWLAATDRHQVVLLGHSTGAQAVLRAALRIPDRLAGVVLAGPTFVPPARSPLRLLARAGRTVLHESPAELRAVLPSYLHSGGAALLRLLISGLRDRPEDSITGLRVPVLILTGEHDGLAPPAWAAELAALVTGAPASFAVLPGGHNGHFRYPRQAGEVVYDAVSGWLGENAPSADKRSG